MASENLSMTMRVSQESESVGNKINVKISLEDNPGVASIRVQVSYDDFLTLENVEFNAALGGQAQTSDYLNNGSPVTLIWVNAFSNFTEDGLFATLSFRINDEAVEDTFSEISVTYDASDIYNVEEQDIYLLDHANKQGECWPAIPTMAEDLKISESTVRRAVKELKKAGLLITEQRFRQNGGKSSLCYKIKSGVPP